MPAQIEITVGDVNDVEAHVFAKYQPSDADPRADTPIVLHGTLRGPFCETARTLPALIMFRATATDPLTAEAIVPDPCVWSSELPHLYQADVEARQGERVLAEFHGPIGFRGTGK
jgi:hypothetical protein